MSIEIAAALDLLDGRAVRLRRGDYDARVADADPVALGASWAAAGVPRLHVVDLEGARAGAPRALALARRVVAAARHAMPGVRVELGGGLRDEAAVDRALAIADEAILGSAAVRDPSIVLRLVDRHPGRIAVALDLRDGAIALDGWTRTAAGDAISIARRLHAAGATRIHITDTARDGMLSGPNLELLAAFRDALPAAWITAAAGIRDGLDIGAVAALGVDGVVVGRALIDGRLTITDALRAARGEVPA